MKATFYAALLCSLGLLIQGCTATSREKEDDLILIEKANLTKAEPWDFNDLYKEVRVIALEATEQSLFADVKQTITTDSAIFILGSLSSMSSDAAVWKYDTNGKLIQQIGGIGQGPGEYTSIERMALRNDTLFIFDDIKERELLYDARSGKHLATLHPDGFEPISAINTVLPIPGSTNFLISSRVTDIGEKYGLYELAEYNPFTDYLKVILPQKFRTKWASHPYAYPSISHYNDETALALLPLNDTIYSVKYKTKEIKPFAVLRDETPAPKFDAGEDFQKALDKAETQGYYFKSIYQIYVSNDYLILNQMVGSVVWDLRSNKGWHTLNGWGVEAGFPLFPIYVVESLSDNTFVCVYRTESFKEYMIPTISNNPVIKTTGDLSDIDPDNTNGVLVVYKLK